MKKRNNSKAELLQLFSSGEWEKLREEVNFLLKKYHTQTEEMKTFLIAVLINTNDNERALHYVEKEMSVEELMTASEGILQRQSQLASIKAFFNSYNVAERILKNIIFVIRKRNDISAITREKIIVQISGQYFYMELFQDLLELNDLFSTPQITNEGGNTLKVFYLSSKSFITKKQHLMEFYELRKMNPENDSDDVVKYLIFFYQTMSQVYLGQIEEDYIDEALGFLNKGTIPLPDKPFHLFFIGMYYYLKKDNEKALPFLKEALSISEILPDRLIFLFWIEQISPSDLSLYEKLFLRCAPFRSLPSYQAGNRFDINYQVVHPVFNTANFKINVDLDCWILDKTEIKEISYHHSFCTKNTLDLNSGLLFKNDQVHYIVSSVRTKILRAIIAHGSEGVRISTLIDIIFDGQFYFYHSAVLRIKNLLSELQKIGFKFKRLNNVIYYNFEKNNFLIVFPKNHVHQGVLSYINKICNNDLTANFLMKNLNIKHASASQYLKKWKENNDVFQSINKPYGHYIVNQSRNSATTSIE